MRESSRRWRLRVGLPLLALALVAAACGSNAATDAVDGAVDEATDAAEEVVDDVVEETTDAVDDATDAMDDEEMDNEEMDHGPLKIAIVAPSAKDDLAFTQSMVDAVNALDREVEFSITDGTFVVEDAAAAIRGYAEDGMDVVIAHGTQYGASLGEIAPEFPEVTFLFGTSTDTMGLDNVFAYTPAADQGGYVNGVLAASISESGVVGVVGPIEAGDAVAYIKGFEAGALASGASNVPITYTGSFGDVALASEAANAHLTNGVDVLTGTAQMVVGAVTVANDAGVPWFGTQANQTSLAPDIVVASQVYHWEVILEEMLALRDAGTLGGQAFEVNLENGGLVIEYNDAYPLSDDARAAADAALAGILDGSVDTGF